MSIEIERKFLVRDGKVVLYTDSVDIDQGYLLNTPEKVIRVRVAGENATLTIKVNINEKSKHEYEYGIPLDEGKKLLDLCDSVLSKTRYFYGRWEIDMIHSLDGLQIAEIELKSEDEEIDIPDFIGEEVTGNPEYYNAELIKKIDKSEIKDEDQVFQILNNEYLNSEVSSGEFILFLFNKFEVEKLFKNTPKETIYRGASLFLEWDFEEEWEPILADGTQKYILDKNNIGNFIPVGEVIGYSEKDSVDCIFEWVSNGDSDEH